MKATRVFVLVGWLSLIAGAWPRNGVAFSVTGSTVTLDVSANSLLDPATEMSGQLAASLLTDAAKRLADDNTDKHPSCPDHPACVNLALGRYNTFTWSGDDEYYNVLVSDDQDAAYRLAVIVAVTGSNINVVHSLRRGTDQLGGMATVGQAECLMAVWSSADPLDAVKLDGQVWAHEFGHMCGVPINAPVDCDYSLMNEALGYLERDQLSEQDVQTIEQWITAHRPAQQAGLIQCDPGAAAAIGWASAVSTQNGVDIRFSTVWEAYHNYFAVNRVDPASGDSLYRVGEAVSSGRRYQITDTNGEPGAVYRLIDQQTDGLPPIPYALVKAEAEVPAGTIQSYDPDSLAAEVAALDVPIGPSLLPDPCSAEAVPEYAILCPDSFYDAARIYAGLWQSRGVVAKAFKRSTLLLSCDRTYTEYIDFAAAHGCEYVLLIGDASEIRWWNDASKWSDDWADEFAEQHSDTASYHPETEAAKDICPTTYVGVPGSQLLSWTYYTPYYSTDLPYADVDGDGLPDLALGRLPVSNINELNAYILKLARWFDHVNGRLGEYPAIFTFAENYHGGGWSTVPAWPTIAAANAMVQEFPSGVTVARHDRIYLGDPDHSYRSQAESDSTAAIVSWATGGGADFIIWNANTASRYVNGFLSACGDTAAPAFPVTNSPYISLGLTCDQNDYDSVEEWWMPCRQREVPRVALHPLVENLLFAPDRGAIAQIGPTRGSRILTNPRLGVALVKRMYEPGTTLGRAFLLAQRECMMEEPLDYDRFRSYVLLGDPRLGPSAVTGVRLEVPNAKPRFAQAAPNPFNPSTRLRFFVGQRARVRIEVFDVHGRLVRMLLDGEVDNPGWNEIRWDGIGRNGESVGSGIYFVRLAVNGIVADVEKLALLR